MTVYEFIKIFWQKYFPSIIWRRQECEVLVCFDTSKVPLEKVLKAERAIRNLGISFDAGAGCGTRHWEWDSSLSGPITVKFKCKKRRKH